MHSTGPSVIDQHNRLVWWRTGPAAAGLSDAVWFGVVFSFLHVMLIAAALPRPRATLPHAGFPSSVTEKKSTSEHRT